MFVELNSRHFSYSQSKHLQKDFKLQRLRRIIQEEFRELRKIQKDVANAMVQLKQIFSHQLYSLIKVLRPPEHSISEKNHRQNSFFKHSKYTSSASKMQEIKFTDSVSIKSIIRQNFKGLRTLESQEESLRAENEYLKKQRQSLTKFKGFSQDYVQTARKTPPKKAKDYTKRNIYETQSKKIQDKEQTRVFSPTFGQQRRLNVPKNVAQNQKKSFLSQRKEQANKSTEKIQKTFGYLRCRSGHQYFKGQLNEGKPHGIGKLTNCCQQFPFRSHFHLISYQGQFQNGLFEGRGKLDLKGGVKFQGNFRLGKRHGEGVIFMGQASQKGRWLQDQLI